VNQYQTLKRVRSEAAGDDPRGGKEDMRVCCFPKSCKYNGMCFFCKYNAYGFISCFEETLL